MQRCHTFLSVGSRARRLLCKVCTLAVQVLAPVPRRAAAIAAEERLREVHETYE